MGSEQSDMGKQLLFFNWNISEQISKQKCSYLEIVHSPQTMKLVSKNSEKTENNWDELLILE